MWGVGGCPILAAADPGDVAGVGFKGGIKRVISAETIGLGFADGLENTLVILTYEFRWIDPNRRNSAFSSPGIIRNTRC